MGLNSRLTALYINLYKARLLVKGYDQKEGVDFTQVFSTVAKLVYVRLLIAMATLKSWSLLHIDIDNGFLHVHFEDEIYMLPTPSYNKANPEQVSKLLKNLPQASF